MGRMWTRRQVSSITKPLVLYNAYQEIFDKLGYDSRQQFDRIRIFYTDE